MTGLYRRLAVWATLALLAGCSTLHPPAGLPLTLDALCHSVFPAGYAVSGTVSTRRAAAQGQYFLTLDTRPPGPRLSLVTLQGLPVYRLRCEAGRARGTHLARIPSALPPQELVQYLGAAYADAPLLAAAGWRRGQAPGGGHRLTDTGGSAAIDVAPEGPAPWYHRLRITDPAREVTITLTIQESRLVPAQLLPQ